MNCPRCQKVMLDVRAEKTNPKAPDFQCPDANCLNDKGYRTGAWLPKPKAAPAQSAPLSAPQAQGVDPTRDAAIQELFWDSFDAVLAGIKKRALTDLFHGDQICSLTATMFIQRSKR